MWRHCYLIQNKGFEYWPKITHPFYFIISVWVWVVYLCPEESIGHTISRKVYFLGPQFHRAWHVRRRHGSHLLTWSDNDYLSDNKVSAISSIHRHIARYTHKCMYIALIFLLSLSAEFLAAAPPIGSGPERSAGRGGVPPRKTPKTELWNKNIASKTQAEGGTPGTLIGPK